MNYKEVSDTVEYLLVQYFNIASSEFSWEKPLEALHEDFKILDYLIFLERLLQQQFKKDIFLLDQISTAIHSPKDIVALIMKFQEKEEKEVVLS